MPSARRDVLLTGGTVLATLSGCAGRPGSITEPTPGTRTPPPPAALAEYDCLPHKPVHGRTVCSQTVDTDSAPVYLSPSDPVAADPAALDLTLHNDSGNDLRFNSYSWTMWTDGASGWEKVERLSSGSGVVTVAAGETHTWTFEEAVRSINDEVTLAPGVYTATIPVPIPGEDGWMACLALVGLR